VTALGEDLGRRNTVLQLPLEQREDWSSLCLWRRGALQRW
jgi:hypothetical protein